MVKDQNGLKFAVVFLRGPFWDDKGVATIILKFADDIKLCRAVGSPNEVITLKNDLRLLMEWSEE